MILGSDVETMAGERWRGKTVRKSGPFIVALALAAAFPGAGNTVTLGCKLRNPESGYPKDNAEFATAKLSTDGKSVTDGNGTNVSEEKTSEESYQFQYSIVDKANDFEHWTSIWWYDVNRIDETAILTLTTINDIDEKVLSSKKWTYVCNKIAKSAQAPKF